MTTNLTGNPASYHTTVPAPDPGDDRTAASVRGGFQYLIDNTAHLKQRADKLDNDNPKVWANPQQFDGGAKLGNGDEFSYLFTTQRKLILPLLPMGLPDSSWNFVGEPAPQWSNIGNIASTLWFLVGPQYLRTGAMLNSVRAGVWATTGLEVRLVASRISYDVSNAGNVPTQGSEVSNPYIGDGASGHVCSLTFSGAIDNAASLFRIGFRIMATGGLATLRWIELGFTDPGPRNF